MIYGRGLQVARALRPKWRGRKSSGRAGEGRLSRRLGEVPHPPIAAGGASSATTSTLLPQGGEGARQEANAENFIAAPARAR